MNVAEQRNAWGTSMRVAIAARPLSPGDALRADDLRWVRLPMAAVPPGTTDRIIGRRLTAPVSVGEIIGPARISAAGDSRLRAKTGVGRVALPVSVGDVSPVVVEGDEVDVLDSMGNEVASAARVLQVRERQITISVERAQLARLGAALSSPVVVILRGPAGP